MLGTAMVSLWMLAQPASSLTCTVPPETVPLVADADKVTFSWPAVRPHAGAPD
jgi:hypothetical protein